LNTQSAIPDEIEQLDYDEDEEEKKPRDKFTSERKTETVTTNVDSNQVFSYASTYIVQFLQKAGAKCFVNPKFQNRLPSMIPNSLFLYFIIADLDPSTSGPPTALPSLLSVSILLLWNLL
jgi:hypothetical protein